MVTTTGIYSTLFSNQSIDGNRTYSTNSSITARRFDVDSASITIGSTIGLMLVYLVFGMLIQVLGKDRFLREYDCECSRCYTNECRETSTNTETGNSETLLRTINVLSGDCMG